MAERFSERFGFDEELRRLTRADPFQAFDIVMSNGDRFVVTDSLHIAVGTDAVYVSMGRAGMQLLQKNQITGIQVHSTV